MIQTKQLFGVFLAAQLLQVEHELVIQLEVEAGAAQQESHQLEPAVPHRRQQHVVPRPLWLILPSGRHRHRAPLFARPEGKEWRRKGVSSDEGGNPVCYMHLEVSYPGKCCRHGTAHTASLSHRRKSALVQDLDIK